jgi:hypothetical protein
MSLIKKFVALAALAVMALGASINPIHADDCYAPETCYVTDAGGWGYEASSEAPSLTPYIVLGAVVLVAIIAIAVRHHHGHHHHAHCH